MPGMAGHGNARQGPKGFSRPGTERRGRAGLADARRCKVTAKSRALELLNAGPVCGQELVEHGVGYRYSARIADLRAEGHRIESGVCGKHRHRARMALYRLVDADQGLLF